MARHRVVGTVRGDRGECSRSGRDDITLEVHYAEKVIMDLIVEASGEWWLTERDSQGVAVRLEAGRVTID